MPWNEPGNKPSGGNRPNKQPSGGKPPEFDKILSDFFKSVKNLFGGGRGPTNNAQGPILFFVLAIVVMAVWSSANRIDESERGVVLIFGKYSHTMQPGLRFTLPKPFAEVYKVNVSKVRQVNNSGQMLTEDKNLIEIDYSIQYRIDEALVNQYLFNISSPENTISQTAESAMRQVAGTSTLDHIVNENRTDVNFKVQSELQSMLNDYGAGIEVRQVNITEVHPPRAVKEAFDDVVKAREDQKTYINEANQYAKSVVPEAEGKVLKIIQEAEGYKESIIADAKGQAERFDLLRTQFELAPEVTRQRMYLETMESVLGDTAKVLVDSEQGNSLMYLPIDQLLKNSKQQRTLPIDLGSTVVNGSTNTNTSQGNNRTSRQGRGR